MLRYLILLTGLLFRAEDKACAQELRTAENDKSLLWEITAPTMQQPSYLFGTIHLLCQEDYIWTPAMRKALQLSEEVCFEMDMDDPTVMMEVAMGMMDRSGKTIDQYFSPEEYKIVERFVTDSLGMNMAMFRQMKPAALQSVFATKVVSCPSPASYEVNIMEEATRQKKEITGLEKPGEQLALFDEMNTDSVIREIVRMATDYSQERDEFSRMLQAYRHQDLPLLFKIIEESDMSGEDKHSFVYDRNKRWISRMEGRMEQRPVFFAVGAGHLWGENGLIELLRKEGYSLRPIR